MATRGGGFPRGLRSDATPFSASADTAAPAILSRRLRRGSVWSKGVIVDTLVANARIEQNLR
jgi:hypothetical protein